MESFSIKQEIISILLLLLLSPVLAILMMARPWVLIDEMMENGTVLRVRLPWIIRVAKERYQEKSENEKGSAK